MRPVLLTIENFGTFYEKTTVDFNKLGDGIYLISGPTGSGKTTIFDAMVYALYGTASGSGRTGLGTDSFYSDFGLKDSPRKPMIVLFTFKNNGNEYNVERCLCWGTTGNAAKTSRTSELRENGTLIARSDKAEKRDDVTQKIKEILGLDVDQFSKIVMLAQGEFRKFLEADSTDREEILGKLFDNKAHRDLMSRLKAVTKRLNDMEKELRMNAGAKIETLSLPEKFPESERIKLKVDHPECMPALKALVDSLAEQQKEITEKKSSINKAVEPLKKQLSAAEIANDLLDSLKQEKKKLDSLQTQKKEYETLQLALDAARKAEKILPKEERAEEAKRLFHEAKKNLEDLIGEQKRLQEQKEKLQNDSAICEQKNTPLIQEKNERKLKLENILSCYEEREKAKAELEAARKNCKTAENELEGIKQNIAALEEKRTELRNTLSELENAGESAVKLAESQRQSAEERVQKLEKLKKDVSQLYSLQKECDDLYTHYLEKLQIKTDKETESVEITRRFLAGQEGLIAERLRDRIRKDGSGTCPVCGAVHSEADFAHFAVLTDKIPTQAEVDESQNILKAAEKEEQSARKAFETKKADAETKRIVLTETATELIAPADSENVLNSEIIAAAESEAKKMLTAAKAREAQTRNDYELKKKTDIELGETDKKLGLAQEGRKSADTACNTARTAQTAAETVYNEKVKALIDYPPEKSEAEMEIDALHKEIVSLAGQIQSTKDALSECETGIAEISGKITSGMSNKANREKEANSAETLFKQEVTDQFGDLDAYRSATAPEGKILKDDELSEWAKAADCGIAEYKNKLNSTERFVKEYEEKTAGMVFVDVADLNSQIAQCNEQIKQLEKKDKEIFSTLSKNREIYENLVETNRKLQQVQNALNKIRPMDITANGRYSFSRYALMDSFKKVIERANERLEIMTDGEYILEQADDESGNRSKGLGLCVYNTVTGTRREKQSLSGGQSFEASLALALGLSDAAQAQSTGMIQIDSMFIDEGFGSLDEERLNKAISVLNSVSGGYRQIGIISHVAGLDDIITKKLVVTATDHGSYIKYESDL